MFHLPSDASCVPPFALETTSNGINTNASGAPTLPNVSSESLVGFLGEFPPDTDDSFLPDHMVSDSSAEDDMTLGPDPDSIEPLVQHSMLNMTKNTSTSPSNAGIAHLSSQSSSHLHRLGSHQANGAANSLSIPLFGSSNQMVSYADSGLSMNLSPHPNYLQVSMENFELPEPSARVKRSSPDTMVPYSRGNGASRPSSMDITSMSFANVDTTELMKPGGVKRRPNRASASPANGSSGEGYFYRSRDKTNYNQAHKGTLPSPPMTPESQKRIRCTWNLEETRMLFDLLKDTTIETFPDAQNIRQYLVRLDPSCTKTLEHVRNKKANLIQKAHSKNVSVAEILISDMHKLEMEMLGPSSSSRSSASSTHSARESSGHSSSSTSGNSMISSTSMTEIPASTSTMITRSTAAQHASQTGQSSPEVNVTLVSGSDSSSRSSSSTHASDTSTTNAFVAPTTSHHPKLPSARPARRRIAKRTTATVHTAMSQPVTSTAQQLAKVAAQQQQQKLSATSPQSSTIFPHDPTVTQSSPQAPRKGSITLSSSSGSTTNLSASGASAASTTPLDRITVPFSQQTPLELVTNARDIEQEKRDKLQAKFTLGPQLGPSSALQSDNERWQKWVTEEMQKVFAGQNEIRNMMQLAPLELSPPPVPFLQTPALRLPVSAQWISTWHPSDSESDSSDEHSVSTLREPAKPSEPSS